MAENYLRRRWQNTKLHTWPGFTWHIGAVQVVGLVGAVVSSYLLGGSEFALAEIKSWGMFTLAWVGAANIAYVILNWLMAPSRIAKEDSVKIADLENRLSDRANLEIRFDNSEPYCQRNPDSSYWLFKVHNLGPAVAENVIAELCSIVPPQTPTVARFTFPITPSHMAVNVLECRINPASDAFFRIARVSKTNTAGVWVVSEIGIGGECSASFNMGKESKFDMFYRVHAANANEQQFTISVSAEDGNIVMVRK